MQLKYGTQKGNLLTRLKKLKIKQKNQGIRG